GHVNGIASTALSRDRRWLVTADAGEQSLLVVWNRHTAAPVRTIVDPHPYGVVACDITPDGKFIVTVSATAPVKANGEGDDDEDPGKDNTQAIAVWNWTDAERLQPICIGRIDDNDLQTTVTFNQWDVTEIATNGKRRAFFWRWDRDAATKQPTSPSKIYSAPKELPPVPMQFYCPVLCPKDLSQRVGDFTMTIFMPNTSQVATGTVDGDVLIWDYSLISDAAQSISRQRRAVKVIRLTPDTSLNALKVQQEFIVVGSADGAVRFYDFGFKIQAWFEDLSAGAIKSISFRATKAEVISGTKGSASRRSKSPSKSPRGASTNGDASTQQSFHCEPFMVTTASALVVYVQSEAFYELKAADRQGHLILQGLDSAVHGLDCHPSSPLVAICGYSGFLQVWDYNTKKLSCVKIFEKLVPHILKFSPNGEYLLVGFTNGHCKILCASDLSELASFRDSQESASHLAFAHESAYCATAHSDCCVYLYKLSTQQFTSTAEWLFGGKHRSHYRTIVGLMFSGPEAGPESKLFSIGQDGRLVEYSVRHSSDTKGLFITSAWTISQEAHPVGAMWFPFGFRGDHSKILISDDHFKLKVWNTVDGNCRSTTLAPTFSGPLDKLLPLRRADYNELTGKAAETVVGEDNAMTAESGQNMQLLNPPYDDGQFLVYATSERILGIIQLPLDGNAVKQMGLVAHPGRVAAIATSHEGKYVFTVGGADLTLNQWAVNTESVAAVSSLAKAADFDGIESYITMIEGGREGELLHDMKQFFYYSQLRSQGEKTTRARKLDGTIPVAEIPNMMCALGFFPSQLEVQNMLAEVRYSRFFETGRYVEKVTFEDFVRLYINHRPTFGTDGRDVVDALLTLMGDEDGGAGKIPRELILQKLLRTDAKGAEIGVPSQNDTDPDERLSYKEFAQCLKSLVQDEDAAIDDVLGDAMDPVSLARDILGFDDACLPLVEADCIADATADDVTVQGGESEAAVA
ncbi:hypothetical protein FOZ63_022065, partial [Perkinsus olseni]